MAFFQNILNAVKSLMSDNSVSATETNTQNSATISESTPEKITTRENTRGINTAQKYCYFCCSYSDPKEKFCSNCGLPLPEKNYKNVDASRSAGEMVININAIVENLENGAEEPVPLPIKTHSGNTLRIKPILTKRDFVKYYPDSQNIISGQCSLDKFTVIDFETANMYPDSICQMGIAVVENGEIVETKNYFIRPPYNNFKNSDLHGITLADVKDAETFAELWAEIKIFIENRLVGAYNANFDIGCLLATLENFKIEPPNFAYFDILQNARNILSGQGIRTFKLSNVARKLKIKLKHHDASSDAVAAAQVQLKLGMSDAFSFMFSEQKNHYETMAHLLVGDDIIKFVKDILNEKTAEEIGDYRKLIDLLTLAQNRGSDKAKCFKFKGAVFEKFGFKKPALDRYRMAYELNEKVGVKGKIQVLEKELKK